MTRRDFAKLIGDITEKHYNSKCDCCKNGADIDMNVLLELEEYGMAPPNLDADKCHVISDVYVYPDFRMYDEDFDNDPQLVARLKRYKERKKL